MSVPYSQQLSVLGGSPPFAFAVATGALPAGLALSSAGLLSGTPTAAVTSNLTIQATGGGSCPTVTAPYSLAILQSVPATPAFFMVLLALMLATASWFALRRTTP